MADFMSTAYEPPQDASADQTTFGRSYRVKPGVRPSPVKDMSGLFGPVRVRAQGSVGRGEDADRRITARISTGSPSDDDEE